MKLNKFVDSISIKAGLLATLALGGCIATTMPYMRTETAQRIAAPAWMLKRDITASPYALRAYEKIHERGGTVNLYISGDGSEFISPEEWENNPTPKNPVALHLASKDSAANIIYLARPCQYTKMLDKKQECEETSWKENRFSQEAINSLKTALDDIVRRYDITGFNLIGYAGGGAMATLLASQRSDILSIRTVAGILDHKAQSDLRGTPELSGSLNPVDIAAKIARIPQFHFIGGQDQYAPPAVAHSYIQSIPQNNCVQTMLVQEAGHDDGWGNKWSELLTIPVTCNYNNNKNMVDFGAISEPSQAKEPAFITREKPSKP